MTKIYFTRHGETVWNRQGRFQGHKNSDLTDKGILAAELLSYRVEDIELDYIVSSPLMRAYNTAEIVRGNKDIEIIKHEGLKEINLGNIKGSPSPHFNRKQTACQIGHGRCYLFHINRSNSGCHERLMSIPHCCVCEQESFFL
jgi:broad specificity phosphatase PhoE